jgi:hypothetical protein
MTKKLLFLFLFFLIDSFGFCQGGLNYSNAFMDIGADARSLAMANSVAATVGDVTAGYYNPAGLVNDTVNLLKFAISRNDYLSSVAGLDYIAGAMRINHNSVVALSVIRYGVDDIPNTIELFSVNGNANYNSITSSSIADYGFLGSYAHTFDGIPSLTVGANVKVLRQLVGDYASAWGLGFDGGAQYAYSGWLFGAMVRDITSTLNEWTYTLNQDINQVIIGTHNVIPANKVVIKLPEIDIGAGHKFYFANKNISLLTELDVDAAFVSRNPPKIEPLTGMEAGYKGIVFLRVGVGNIPQAASVTGITQTSFQPDFGIGIRIKSFAFDYALTSLRTISVPSYSNVFSFKFSIKKRKR